MRPNPTQTSLVTLFLFTILAMPALAVDYHVEMLVFANNDEAAFHSEQWSLEAQPPAVDDSLALFDGHVRAGFRRLDPMQLERNLGEARRLLESSGHYTVLRHVAWQQPGLSAEDAVRIRLHGGEDYSLQYPERMQPRLEVGEDGTIVEIPGPERLEQLDGTVRVILGRYLHVHTDLVLRKPVVVERIDQESGEPTQMPVLLDIPMQEQRRMRSRELHYIDHPLLGVLVQITPLETPAE